MNRAISKTADPWRATVNVARIPEIGLHRDVEAGPSARAQMADVAGLRDISSARASFDLRLGSGGKVHVTGHLSARVGQTCVVTLDPIENDIEEDIDLIFAPAAEVTAVPLEEGAATEVELGEQPEPIVDGIIDLGRLATDVLYLAIDPYPRKAGAVFESRVAAADPEDHPFAALKAFKGAPKKPKSDDPEGT